MGGTVSTFNWQANRAGTHLATQFYDICVRRESGRCVLCWSPTNETPATAASNTNPGNFGISNAASPSTASDTQDHIIIPNGVAPGANGIPSGTSINGAQITSGTTGELGAPSIFCGRFLNAANEATEDGTVCTRSRQFNRLGVRFDPAEFVAAAGAEGQDNEDTQEASGRGPLGTQGFELGFAQLAC